MLRRIVDHFRYHSASATGKHLSRRMIRNLDSLTWGWVVPALWPVLLGLIALRGAFTKSKQREGGFGVTVVMLVNNPGETRKFPSIGPNLTERLEVWIREQIPGAKIVYRSSLEEEESEKQTVLVVANYDWLAQLRNPVRRVLQELWIARKKGYVFLAAPVDLWGPKLNLLGSILVGLTDGHTLVASNVRSEAIRFRLPKPWGPVLWTWPSEEVEKWAQAPSWGQKDRVALIAMSGDPRRTAHFSGLADRLFSLGFDVIETQQKLEWDEYVWLVKKSRLIFTTCEIQEIFFIGPKYFRNLIPDGHITMRVWEGFATKATVFTNEISSLRQMGFLPGKHYVRIPNFGGDWSRWELPDDYYLESVALEGHVRFNEVIAQASFPPALKQVASGPNCSRRVLPQNYQRDGTTN